MKWKVKTLIFVLLAILALQAPMTSQAAKKVRKSSATVKMERLEKKVSKYIKSSCPISANGQKASTAWSVYVKDLKTKKSFTINKKSFFSASTIKLYAMAAAYDKAKKGKLAMNSSI